MKSTVLGLILVCAIVFCVLLAVCQRGLETSARSALPNDQMRTMSDTVRAVSRHFPAPDRPDRLVCREDGQFEPNDAPPPELPASPFYETARRAAMRVVPVFPKTFNEPMTVRSWASSVRVQAVDASASAGALADDGSLIYPDAFDGCDVVYRYEPLKTEEFIVVKTAESTRTWSWTIELGSGDRALKPRLTPANTIELLDHSGVPRLRIDAPIGRDAAGQLLRVGDRLKMSVSNPSPDIACLEVFADLEGLSFPVVIDPTWSSTGSMSVVRNSGSTHTLTLLQNGNVLAAGGQDLTLLSSCELFDPISGTWSMTGAMAAARTGHQAVHLLDDRVLVLDYAMGACEMFTPGTGIWTAANLPPAGIGLSGLLSDGRVYSISNNANSLFNPATGTWTTAAAYSGVYSGFSLTSLSANKLLKVGGLINGSSTAICELYDASADSWSTTASLNQRRAGHSAILLGSGKVLVVGGRIDSVNFTTSCEIFDAASNTWTAVGALPPLLKWPPIGIELFLLSNGRVLCIGQNNEDCLVFDPTTGLWAKTVSLPFAVTSRKVLLNDPQLLISTGSSCILYQLSPVGRTQSNVCNEDSTVLIALESDSIDVPLFSVVNQPSNGILSGNPPNITYTPNANFTGSDSFGFSVTDSFGTSNPATVTITVNSANNDPPTLDPISNLAIISEDAGMQTISLSGISAGPYESQQLTITATSSNPSVISNPAVTYTNPSATGSLTYSPVPNASGSATITVTVTDNGGTANGGVNTFSRSFAIEVSPINDAPVAQNTAETVTDSATLNSNFLGVDVDNNSLTYRIISNGSKGTTTITNAATGAFSYTLNPGASGTDSFTFVVSDGQADSNIGTVNVTITPTPPQITSALTASGTVGLPFTYTITATGTPIINFTASAVPSGLGFDTATISGVPVVAGTTNVVLTANNDGGSVSETLVINILPGNGIFISSSLIDSDRDGFSDELELGLGTSPTDSQSTPINGAAIVAPEHFFVAKVGIKLNFTKSGNDSVSLSGLLPVPDSFAFRDKEVVFDIGGIIQKFMLDAKGNSTPKGLKIGKPVSGLSKFSVKLSRGDYRTRLSDEGITATANVKGAIRQLPISILFDGNLYRGDRTVILTAKQDVSAAVK